MVRFSCPECGAEITAAAEKVLRRVECPTCEETVLVPLAQRRVSPERQTNDLKPDAYQP